MSRYQFQKFISLFVLVLLLGFSGKNVLAQNNVGATVLPLVGITIVPDTVALPKEGGDITFIYKVVNAGSVPLNDVTVVDDKCSAMSGELGDTNGNHLLDTNEVWIYNCTTNLKQTTTNTVTVTAFADGFQASNTDTTTVNVAGTTAMTATTSPGLPNGGTIPTNNVPGFPDNGPNPNPNMLNITFIVWGILGLIIVILSVVLLLIRKKK